jgi:hypothetical protein
MEVPMRIGRDLYSMAEWWTRQSMAGDKGGSFNIPLYIEYLKARNSCLDYHTTMKIGSAKVMTITQEPSAYGKKHSSGQQVLMFTEHSK